ncbi:MAG: hypothetical protein RCG15_05165 [Candidatus Rickettsia vulgarisii]
MASLKEFNDKIKKNSFDDLEVEKRRKESLSNSKESLRSHDDLSIKSPKLSEEEFFKKFEKNEEIAKPKSRIRRFISYVGNVNKIKSGVNWFLDSKIGKILTGTATGRAMTVGFAILTLSSAFSPAAPIVLAMAGVSLAAVAVGVAVDTYKTRSLRKLATESNLLVKNRGNIDKQKQLFKIDPSLEKILDKQLNKSTNEIVDDKYKIDYTTEIAKEIKNALVNNTPSIANFVVSASIAATGNVISILKAIKDGTIMVSSLSYSGYSAKQGIDLVTALKINVNNELKHQDVGHYDNLQELGNIVKNQEIQTLAITGLMCDKNYFKLTDQQKRDKFEEYKENITKLKKNEKVKKEGYLGDFAKAHNPFYEQPSKVSEYTELTKAIANRAKDIAEPVKKQFAERRASLPNMHQESKTQESLQNKKGKNHFTRKNR